ncbi:RHS repeat domain-containing protein [Flectobacillus major]|uniref:RHS repeat domain-containing protein n=1 Tax=Flectobacillus major TaxID=103 RepID=UPI000407F1B9|nr:RHS repeat-associated core domain-containing protein [Flectobacillus major]
MVQNGVTTLYQYDATGKKLKETIGSDITDYSANKIYKNNTLYQISHDEGRIVNGEYEYNITDHLGNLRVAFKDSLGIAKITQANAYGVWGEDLPTLSYQNTPNLNNFKFTGKEFESLTGLNDFGWRQQDPILGIMWGIDALGEDFKHLTPFNYVENNPISKTDPDGNASEYVTTQYIDPNGNTIINTNDGRNDVFVVHWDKLKNFRNNVNSALPEITNSIGWNDYWRSESRLLIPSSLIDMHHSQAAIDKLIKYALSNNGGDMFDYVFEEIKAQWQTLELVVGGLSAGFGGYTMLGTKSVKSLKGNVANNFKRFLSKVPSNSKSNASYKMLDDGSFIFEATSPGKVPGSKAIYQKWVNSEGETVKMLKTTVAPDGSIIHVKPKK